MSQNDLVLSHSSGLKAEAGDRQRISGHRLFPADTAAATIEAAAGTAATTEATIAAAAAAAS